MDFAKALTYPFEDEDWLKKLAFLLIGIIPIVGTIAVEGWAIETARNVRSSAPKPLASWDDFGAVFSRGIPLFLGMLVYSIPTIILACGANGLPIIMAGAAAGTRSNSAGTAVGSAGGLLALCCGCLAFIVAIASFVTYMGGFIRFMDKPEFGTFMEFGENFGLVQSNIGDFGMAILYMLGAGLIAGLVTWTFIGGLLAVPFLTYFRAHIMGQLAAKLGGGAVSAAPQV